MTNNMASHNKGPNVVRWLKKKRAKCQREEKAKTGQEQLWQECYTHNCLSEFVFLQIKNVYKNNKN